MNDRRRPLVPVARCRSVLMLLAIAVMLAGPRAARADVSLGGWMAYSPDDITGFATLSGDDGTVDVTLPFAFGIEGTSYTTVALSTNGWLEFGGNTSGNSDPTNDCLPTAAHTHPFLAAYWDDLRPFGTNVRYGTVGTSPNRVFIVDVEADVVPSLQDVHYQVQLHEKANLITVRYRDTQNQANGQGATIGFQGAGGAGATAEPLTCDGKIMDDNRPDEGWSVDVGRAGHVVLAADTEFSPDDIASSAVLSGNDATANAGLGFAVTIEGTSYSSITLSTNGWIEFGSNTSGNSDPTNDCLPTAAHTNPLLAFYWDDMMTFGTAIRYGTLGTSPNRTFIADFQIETVAGGGSENDISGQVEIHEGSSLVSVRYRDKGDLVNGQGATIGFQGAGGASAHATPLTCNGKILDDNDASREGWSVDPRVAGAMAVHGVMAHSPDDIAGFTSLAGDNATATVSLPFGVVVDGTTYGSLAISTNGWLELGGNTAADSDPTNDCLPTAAHTNPFLAAFWDDLQTEGDNVRYGTVGTAPNRTFIVDEQAFILPSPDSSNDALHFQVEIHETSNVINVKYHFAERYADGQTATIGFQRAGGGAAVAHPLVCNGKILDDNRDDAGWSVAPLPICGNGILESAGGEQCDGGATNGAGTSCCTATCTFRASGGVCRPGGGAPCDLNETCTGSSATCPADDAPGRAGVTCRLGSGDLCDPDEVCNGAPGVACPADVVSSGSTVCRTGSGDLCDPAETCTGVAGQACPANVVEDGTTVCRTGSGDACDLNETCPGVPGASCPPNDAPLKTGVVCRAGSGDVCDLNEACTGVPGATCPPDDAPGKAGVVCRLSSADGAFCDDSERCTGVSGSTCPADDAPSKINVVCRPGSGDLCDPDERCTGLAGQDCPPDVVANPSTVCRTGSGDLCDPSEHCTAIPGAPCPADVVSPSGTVCRSATGVCDVAEHCNGTAHAACPADAFAPSSMPCDADADLCTSDACNGTGACVYVEPLDCEDGNVCTQDSCDPFQGCVSTGTPATTCLPAAKATFAIKDNVNDLGDQLKLSWKGGPVLLGDLGDPTQGTRYELCVYDDTGVRTALGVPPGAGWGFLGSAAAPRGYKFKDAFGQYAGVKQMSLKASSLPKAKLKLVGRGPNLPDPTLPFALPVLVQLHASDGACWEAGFGVLESKRNDATGFSGRMRTP